MVSAIILSGFILALTIIKTKLLLDMIIDMRQTLRTVCQCQWFG